MTITKSRTYSHSTEGGGNQEDVEFYHLVFTETRRLDINPVITLNSYDTLDYFEEIYSGWTNQKIIDELVDFADTCFTEYKVFSISDLYLMR